MTDVETLALCRAIAEKVGWVCRDEFVWDDTGPIMWHLRKPGDLAAFIAAVEGTLTEGQQEKYGRALLHYALAVPRLMYFRIATAPASVRLQSLREVLG